jgi:soluble lytic murein transglycosylase
MTRPILTAAASAAFLVLLSCTGSPGLEDSAAIQPAPANQAEPEPVVSEAETDPVLPAAEVPPPLPTQETRAAGLGVLQRGQALAAARQYRSAVAEYAEAELLLPPFAGWARVLAADAARRARDTAGVRRQLEHATGPAAEWGWRVRVSALREAGDLSAAADVAAAAAASLPPGAAAAAAWAEAGETRARLGDIPGALSSFRRAMQAEPGSRGALAAARGALDVGRLSAEDRLLIGRTLLRHGGIERGVANVDAYLASGQGSPEERARVHEETGRALFAARRYASSAPYLRAAAAYYSEAAYLLGRALYRSGSREAGTAALREVAERFPTDPAAADALLTLGELAQDDGRISAAREYYRAAIATGVHTPAAADAAVRLAMVAVRENSPEIALSDLGAYLSRRPADRLTAPAHYWAGRAHGLTGNTGAAQTSYRRARDADPISYYGMRAAERLGSRLAARELPSLPRASRNTEAEIETAFFRIDLLRDLGMTEEAAYEMARLRSSAEANPAAMLSVAEGMIPRGQPIAAALLGREVQERIGEWDERLLRLVYQFPFRDLVVREAARHGLDPFLVAGLIRQESYFNPVAVSSAGAIGLMQVMPATGRSLAGRAGIARFNPEMLKQPEINVRLGTLFLADQMRRWQGREADVFAAYNAGPGRVVRWRSFPEYQDPDLFVERIPFHETRDYVKKVQLHARIYRALYDTP